MRRFSLIFLIVWILVATYTPWSFRYLRLNLGPIPFGDAAGATYWTPALPTDRYNLLFLIHYSDHQGVTRYDDTALRQNFREFGLERVQISIKVFGFRGREIASYKGPLSQWLLSDGRGFDYASAFWGEYDPDTIDTIVGFRAMPFARYQVWASLEGNHPLLEQVPIDVGLRGRRDDGYYAIIWRFLLSVSLGIYLVLLLFSLGRHLWIRFRNDMI